MPLPNVNAAILKKVIQWATYHKVGRPTFVRLSKFILLLVTRCPGRPPSPRGRREQGEADGRHLLLGRRLPQGHRGCTAPALLLITYKHQLLSTLSPSSELSSSANVQVDQGTLFELILAANYLDIKGLLDVTCKTVANMIKGQFCLTVSVSVSKSDSVCLSSLTLPCRQDS